MSEQDIKTFRAATMRDALAQVRRSFGSDALILKTRRLVATDSSERGDAAAFEVTAAKAIQGTTLEPNRVLSAETVVEARPESRDSLRSLETRVDRLTSMVERFIRDQPYAPPERWQDLFARLVELEFPPDLVRGIIEHIDRSRPKSSDFSSNEVQELAIGWLSGRVETAGINRGRNVLALIGPTGCGKTTIVGKLAAAAKFQSRAAAIISLEPQGSPSAAAAERFSQMLTVPLTFASSKESVEQALRFYQAADMILIDTPATNPGDPPQLEALAQSLRASEIRKVLVVSTTTSSACVRLAIENYTVLNYDRVILSKVDETPNLGALAWISSRTAAPVAYITTGRNVPDDIEEVDNYRLAALSLGVQPVVVSQRRLSVAA